MASQINANGSMTVSPSGWLGADGQPITSFTVPKDAVGGDTNKILDQLLNRSGDNPPVIYNPPAPGQTLDLTTSSDPNFIFLPPSGSAPIHAAAALGSEPVFNADGSEKFNVLDNNVLHLDGGDHQVQTGWGNDYAVVQGGNDTVYAGNGNDTVAAGDGDDFVQGGDGSDFLKGEGGNDTVRAGVGDDVINDGGNDDTVFLGKGNDTYIGSGGDDTIDMGDGGLPGFDLLDYSNNPPSAGFGNDVALGFSHGDILRVADRNDDGHVTEGTDFSVADNADGNAVVTIMDSTGASAGTITLEGVKTADLSKATTTDSEHVEGDIFLS